MRTPWALLAVAGLGVAACARAAPPAPVGPPRDEWAGVPGARRVTFLSDDPGVTWDVVLDGQLICITPCELHIPSHGAVELRERRADGNTGFRLEAPRLPPDGEFTVLARRRDTGNYVGGVVLLSIGIGMMVFSPLATLSSERKADQLLVGGAAFGVIAGILLYTAKPGASLQSGRGRPRGEPDDVAPSGSDIDDTVDEDELPHAGVRRRPARGARGPRFVVGPAFIAGEF